MSRSTAFRAAPARVATMDPRQNRLLAALPPAQWAEWAPRIEHLDFPLGHVVHEPGDPYHYVYFPLTTVISIMRTLSTGASTQLAVVGHEGLLGVPVFIGGGPAGNRAVVQHAGA
ncbi:MAG TPA: hypothetical protein VLI46_02815, partial [Ramlibacter sp.]|nr:hypothetical protein [Ramlibacter sp.]